jgi:hypothetical protein
LRRLTRYEIENTLEDLLQIELKPGYSFSKAGPFIRAGFIEKTLPEEAPGKSGFVNDAQQLTEAQIPLSSYIRCIDYALEQFASSPPSIKKVLGIDDKDKAKALSKSQAENLIKLFGDRAFRGTVPEDEYQQLVSQYHADVNPNRFDALLDTMRTVVLSPRFLYRFEEVQGSEIPYKIRGTELAVRLSYFLWSSMPDEELLTWSRGSSAFEEAELVKQVHRMLNSPKRIAISEKLAGQWLEFDEILKHRTNDEITRRSIYDEILFGFDELIKSDRSIFELVDSDWIYISPYNKSYGIVDAKPATLDQRFSDILSGRKLDNGEKAATYTPPALFRIKSDVHGGLITSTGTMRLTSAPTRTSPIRRGVWILQNILGDQIEAPQNVPPLEEILKQLGPAVEKPTKKQIVELHTAADSCAACHAKIDPLGFGLENLSHLGTWRTRYPDKTPVQAEGKLPRGQAFTNPKMLKQELLASYKDDIAENITRRFLAYAIGRELQPFDRVTVERITKDLAANDYRMSTLITSVVLSPQFLKRQDKQPKN